MEGLRVIRHAFMFLLALLVCSKAEGASSQLFMYSQMVCLSLLSFAIISTLNIYASRASCLLSAEAKVWNSVGHHIS